MKIENRDGFVIVVRVEPDGDAEAAFMNEILSDLKKKYSVRGVFCRLGLIFGTKTNDYIMKFHWLDELREAYDYLDEEFKRHGCKSYWRVSCGKPNKGS